MLFLTTAITSANNFLQFFLLLVALVGIAAAVYAARSMGNKKRSDDTIKLQDELLDKQKEKAEADRSDCKDRIDNLTKEVSALRTKVDFLTSGFAAEIAIAVVAALPSALEQYSGSHPLK